MMANTEISTFWKKLEDALSQLEQSTQIWLLGRFIAEANKSMNGKYEVYKCLN